MELDASVTSRASSADVPEPALTAILVVCNEAHAIAACLQSLSGIADEVVVLDSGSIDSTLAIARSFGAQVHIIDWPGFGRQKNRALARARGRWVLSIDADERVTPELAEFIREIVIADTAINGFFIEFLPTWCGRPVRFGDWGGKRHLRLFRRGSARFTDDAIHERVICAPPHGQAAGLMLHDTVADEDEAADKCARYARLSAEAIARRDRGGIGAALVHSAWTWARGYLFKRGFVDGLAGWNVASANAKGTWLRYRIAGRLRKSRAAKAGQQSSSSGGSDDDT